MAGPQHAPARPPWSDRGLARAETIETKRPGAEAAVIPARPSITALNLMEPAMTPDQIRHVQTSFARVEPIAGEAATLFYANLFAADPALRAMFRGDMTVQGSRLMQMIGGAVRLLERPSALMRIES